MTEYIKYLPDDARLANFSSKFSEYRIPNLETRPPRSGFRKTRATVSQAHISHGPIRSIFHWQNSSKIGASRIITDKGDESIE
jgi:hypothetical protein